MIKTNYLISLNGIEHTRNQHIINMKIFMCIAGLLLFFSCSKERLPPSNPCRDAHIMGIELETGPSSANTNFIEWEAKAWSSFGGGNDTTLFRLSIGIENTRNCDIYEMLILEVPFDEENEEVYLSSTGQYKTAKFAVAHGGDAIAEQYILVDELPNSIKFTKTNDTISGEYDLTFVISPKSVGRGMYNPSWPDTLKFTKGIFIAPLWRH